MNTALIFRVRLLIVVGACVVAALASIAGAGETPSPAAILQNLRGFNEMGRVLYVAAHPDDENTQLIAYLARGRLYRTGYLSLTRGDGGQNVLGPEFGDELGVIRTQELLAARRVDGGVQFFTRARDFGYSKDYRETLAKWDHQEVLADIVRVIRTFRPDVIITRFSTLPGPTHGHHTASAILALEAFKVSADAGAFANQLGELKPWQAKRIMLNGFGVGFRRADQVVPGATTTASALRINIGGMDPVLGISFAQIATKSRSMHKTQGFANYTGGAGGGGARYESFQLLDGEPANGDIMDGVDTTWGRMAGGEEIGVMAKEAIAKFNPDDPGASVAGLLEIKRRLAELTGGPIVAEKQRQLDGIIQSCLGLEVATTIPEAEVVPGEGMKLHLTAVEHSRVPVKWLGVRYPSLGKEIDGPAIAMEGNVGAARDSVETLPPHTELSQPYWLREPETAGMFVVDDASLIGRPENPPVFPVEMVFEVGGQSLVVDDEPVASGRRLAVIPPVSLRFASEVALFSPGGHRTVTVEMTANRADSSGVVDLDLPAGWTASPGRRGFDLQGVGDRARLSFDVTAPPLPGTARIVARAHIGDVIYESQRIEIKYPHIPEQLLQPLAAVKAVCLDLQIRGREIGYISGAGDSVAQSLEEMGYHVRQLSGADLTAEGLRGLDAVVVGIRAFNVRTDLAAGLPALFEFVKAGGNVVVQYNTPNDLKTTTLGPYELKLSRDLPHNRVTDEKAPVTLLVPDHAAFTTPNRITAADFDGWVQERGLNFPSEWDTTHFTALLACGDLGEAPLTSGLLVARYGKGYYVYTGLSWFRQLPAGVPGAYRLMANLISLGK